MVVSMDVWMFAYMCSNIGTLHSVVNSRKYGRLSFGVNLLKNIYIKKILEYVICIMDITQLNTKKNLWSLKNK